MNLRTFFNNTNDEIIIKSPVGDTITMAVTKHAHTIFYNNMDEITYILWGKAVIPTYLEHTSLTWLESKDKKFWEYYKKCWGESLSDKWKQDLEDNKNYKGWF